MKYDGPYMNPIKGLCMAFFLCQFPSKNPYIDALICGHEVSATAAFLLTKLALRNEFAKAKEHFFITGRKEMRRDARHSKRSRQAGLSTGRKSWRRRNRPQRL